MVARIYKLVLLIFLLFNCTFSEAASDKFLLVDTTINPPLIIDSYNDSFYNSVLEAASSIAQPYLLHQGFYTMQGVTVSGSSILYNGVTYPVSESYFNPGTGYYIASSSYAQYGISNFSTIWPTRCPNAFYDSSTHTFFSKIDCVGFGTRLLSVVGGKTSSTNAYLNLIKVIKANNVAPIASKGFVAMAYQFAVDFPTIKSTAKPGWTYVSGNVCDVKVIDGYNHVLQSAVGTYNGVRKGGFALCQPGDVLAFGYDSSASANGHFMILDKEPQLLNASTLQTYYPKATAAKVKAFATAHKVYAVSVIDDSGKNAHFFDSRTSYSGIGHGTVLIVADTADDAPVGFIFSPSTNISYSPIDTSHCYAISVGRYVSSAQLPVSLTSFVATENEKIVSLDWQTAEEMNVDKFQIERSGDGKTFAVIGSQNSIGVGNNNYHFIDYAPLEGNNYYRIKINNKDGSGIYSKVYEIVRKNTKSRILYPNPTKDVINIVGSDVRQIVVVDKLGRVVLLKLIKDNSNIHTINLENLPSGSYYVRLLNKLGNQEETGFIKY